MRKFKIHMLTLFILTVNFVSAQVGINTENPAVTIDIQATSKGSTTAEGLIAPRLTGAELAGKNNQYQSAQNASIVYVTVANGSQTGKTQNVKSAGYYYYDSTASLWIPLASTAYTGTDPITVTGTSIGLKDLGVTTAKLAANSVSTAKITDANVTESKLANNSISTNKIVDSNVTTAKIADSNITNAKLAANSVSTAKITDANVTESKLANNSVSTNKIVDSNVTTAKIADGNIIDAKLATNSVSTVKIVDANVTESKLATNSVSTNKIVDGNVTTAKINNQAVTPEKIMGGTTKGYVLTTTDPVNKTAQWASVGSSGSNGIELPNYGEAAGSAILKAGGAYKLFYTADFTNGRPQDYQYSISIKGKSLLSRKPIASYEGLDYYGIGVLKSGQLSYLGLSRSPSLDYIYAGTWWILACEDLTLTWTKEITYINVSYY